MNPRRSICYVSAAVFAGTLLGPAWAQPHKDLPAFQLSDPGTDKIVDYEKYGTFSNVGKPGYLYIIRDREGLARAVGEGVYPNVSGVLEDPEYQHLVSSGGLKENAVSLDREDHFQAAFFKWSTLRDQPTGLRQFYAAQELEKAGQYLQAIKAYQAVVIHFPKLTSYAFFKTPWYIGPTALDRLSFLIRQHPELGLELRGGRVRVLHRFDDDSKNDIFQVDPGRIVAADVKKSRPERLDLVDQPIQRQLGKGRIHLSEYANGHWQLFVDSEPYVIRGMSYSATPVGKSPDEGTLVVHRDWMVSDLNKNGRIDGPYDSWVDANRNDLQDANEPVVGDFRLMQEMGINTLRLYHHAYNKKLLQDLFRTYGIRVIMGDYLGAYAIGSGASWEAGTDYSDPAQQEQMLASVREMVEEYKNEPYVLFWSLGNENLYGVANNSRENPKAYFAFVNRAAQLIKSLDPDRPVAIANGDLLFLDTAARECPDVDIFGVNVYRGGYGMGDSFWKDLSDEWGKPVFVSEFGCPAYHHAKSRDEAEFLQAEYLRNNWDDIEYNLGGGLGVGNALGGVLFEWMDEWWKAGPLPKFNPSVHDTVGQFGGPFPDGWSYEEWYGLVSQGSGLNSPYERQLRKAYFVFKDELWNRDKMKKRGLPQ